MYWDQEMSQQEIADELDCSLSAVSLWMRDYGIERRSYSEAHSDKYADAPWRDKERLRVMYSEKKMSQTEIAEELDCTRTTIGNWLDEFGIEIRKQGRQGVNFRTYLQTGKERWEESKHGVVLVHRLLAVAEFGFESVKDMDVHHLNTIPWDNRPENLELLTQKEHGTIAKKGRWVIENGEPKLRHFDGTITELARLNSN
jgi:predicted transcriptional regulator